MYAAVARAQLANERASHLAVLATLFKTPPIVRDFYCPKMTIVVLPVSGIEPPLLPEATATYCLPFCS